MDPSIGLAILMDLGLTGVNDDLAADNPGWGDLEGVDESLAHHRMGLAAICSITHGDENCRGKSPGANRHDALPPPSPEPTEAINKEMGP